MIVFGDNKIIMSDERQENAIKHLEEIIRTPFGKEKIRIMPDYHEGKGCVIGFTSTYSDVIIPFFVGVDIGCGVIAYNIGKVDVDFEAFDNFVRGRIPLGKNHQRDDKTFRKYMDSNLADKTKFPLSSVGPELSQSLWNGHKLVEDYNIDFGNIKLQLGTLGGGNHFVELDKDDEGNVYIMVHTGSRNFGLRVANYYQEKAKRLMKEFHIDVLHDLEYLPYNYGGREYLYNMRIAQEFAQINRYIILCEILEFFNHKFWHKNLIESVHNYIDVQQKIIRKGAIKCMGGDRVLIPLNMRDGTIIGVGGKNKKLENWNFSMPHGAGRIMGRQEAKRQLKIEDFEKSMEGIWSSSVESATLDEAPMAYKEKNVILDSIKDVLEIETIIKPIYNLKAKD